MTELLNDIIDRDEDDMEGRYLAFQLDNETFGIEIRNVTEIVGIQPITEMPEMPDYVKGIINLRGSIIPVIDVRLRFKKPPKDYNDRTCVIVTHCGGVLTGLIVDGVSEVLSIPFEHITEKPEISTKGCRGYIKNIGIMCNDQIVLLIDCEKLLNEEEIEIISA